MTITIDAIDSEFAVATGSNMNSGAGRSRFDYPPTSSKNLQIVSNEGDTSPGQFSVGDTYDLIYGNGGGGKGGTFDDAVVLRSDDLPVGGHVVVFEGTNADGDLEQIVWTPNFDLEGWYFDNFDQGNSPEFYTEDQDAATQYQFVCIGSGTKLNIADGEKAVDDLRVGDLVETLDHGFQPIIWLGRRKIQIDSRFGSSYPILIQPNAVRDGSLIRNVIVSAQHRLMLRDKNDVEKLAPAKTFLGLPGVRQMWGQREIKYYSLLCAHHVILNASGLAIESFLPGPQGLRLLRRNEILEVRHALAKISKSGAPQIVSPVRPLLGASSGSRALAAGFELGSFAGAQNVSWRSDSRLS